MSMNRFVGRARPGLVALSACALLAFGSRSAVAQSLVKDDGAHPDYAVELEPHGVLGAFLPPGDGDGVGLGAGLRATIPLAPRGFIDGVNDSVGLGFGFDYVHHFGSGPSAGRCAEYRGSGAERICVRVEGAAGPSSYFYVPVVMQWNFFFTKEWSAFGEPGLGLFFQSRDLDGSLGAGVFPVFQVGGRYHFSEKMTLTLRIGYPTINVGVSFFL